MAALAPAYVPRRPTETVLYGLVRENLESFLAYAREHYEGGLPRYVEAELRAYLDCGVFARGFTRCHCDSCGHDLLVAFSCKGRSLCPSCCGRRMANTAAHLVENVLTQCTSWIGSVCVRTGDRESMRRRPDAEFGSACTRPIARLYVSRGSQREAQARAIGRAH